MLEGLAADGGRLNGERVEVLGFEISSGRFQVRLLEGKRLLAVRPCSLAPEEEMAGTPSSGNSSSGQGRSAAESPLVDLISDDEGGSGEECAGSSGSDHVGGVPLGAIDPPPPVGVASMDEEHGRCTEAINALLSASANAKRAASKGPGTTSTDGVPVKLLQAVVDELEDHFAHGQRKIDNICHDTTPNDANAACLSHIFAWIWQKKT